MSFKVSNAKQMITTFGVLFIHNTITAQSLVIQKYNDYKKTVVSDASQRMINIVDHIPTIVLDLRYATENNFTGRILYPPGSPAFLRKPAIQALALVQKDLNEKGLGLKIFDAYRPYAVTEMMWNLIKDERYVAHPRYGSGHNRGIAVDLTIINTSTNEVLNMGTGFDNFSDTAHHQFKQLSAEVVYNRNLLKTTMERHGFKAYDAEWWHYTFSELKDAAVLNIPFKKLQKLSRK